MLVRLLHVVVNVAIAVAVVVLAWSVTPPSVFKERVLDRDPTGAVRSLAPGS